MIHKKIQNKKQNKDKSKLIDKMYLKAANRSGGSLLPPDPVIGPDLLFLYILLAYIQ